MRGDAFEESYQKLNPEQREAVDAIEGPVMVVAGPGTGKTQVLTLRIANILRKTQVNPRNILALTFTESGAGEMRRRLVAVIGPAAHAVSIFTFHGFCNDVIRTYPEEFGFLLRRKPADEVSQIRLIEKIVDRAKLEVLRPATAPSFYVEEIKHSIGDLKREGVTSERFAEIVAREEERFAAIPDLRYGAGRNAGKMKGKYQELEKHLLRNKELLSVYRGYREALAEEGLYDYDDMILEVVSALERRQELLLRLQERFQYILIDEHQDTNDAQNRVAELLGNFFENPNLFVVGDEKQAIFRFQGASLENFLYFKRLYPEARLIALKRNYRSQQGILDFAQSFIQHRGRRRIGKVLENAADELVSEVPHPLAPVRVFALSRPEVEMYFVSAKIGELLQSGVPPREIAVIYRDNRDAIELSAMLSKTGVPFHVFSSADALDDPGVQKLIAFFEFLGDFPSEEKLFRILHIDFLEIPSLDIYKLYASRRRQARPLLELMRDETHLKQNGIEAVGIMRRVAADLLRWHRLAQNASFAELFETVMRESGLLAALLRVPDSAPRLARIQELYARVKRLAKIHRDFSLNNFLEYLDVLREHKVAVRERKTSFVPNAVRLMTAHGAKGLEFDYVFVVNVFDGHWGNKRRRELIRLPALARETPEGERDPNDEERRLFYVAVTRARKEVFVSYAVRSADGRERLAAQFIEEAQPEFKARGEAERYEAAFEENRGVLFAQRSPQSFSLFEKDYVGHLFRERGLSATALNNFLRCPWQYFYANLIQVPRVQTPHQMYGKAVHAALRDFFDSLRGGKDAKEFLMARFEEALREQPMAAPDYEAFFEKGRRALPMYFDRYHGSWNANTHNEFRISRVPFEIPGQAEPIRLTGTIDKIEYEADGREVNVVDYKTGRPKSRNELEGRTKNATGDYRRQLVFYKLLLDGYPAFASVMTSGEIDFIETDARGNFHKERFEVTERDAQELKKTVLDVTQHILNLSFWNERCPDAKCEFCKLRNEIL